ncbi:MAG: hypothetical protein A2808_03295 [Candidatus Moranbacteria bacterium RIFCSPHIGHO2_01_FULL_55_24]|nr:MAG: hypothetical protein A2808_03295 [Candidatus Moranbacteria bacterium RIFCSPHIGHO2_01_FULL_55_24]
MVARFIDSFDLGFLRPKLKDSEMGPGWNDEEIERAIRRFKRFFYMTGTQTIPGGPGFVPTKEIDWVWHMFLLYTKRYAETCFNLFGRMIHHAPDEDASMESKNQLRKGFSATAELYQRLFGENYGEVRAECGACCDGSGGCHSCQHIAVEQQ